MVKYIIAAHGNLADGFKSSLEVLMGKGVSDNIITINGFTEDKNPVKTIENFISTLNDKHELIIFTDWFSGSINQGCIPHVAKGSAHVITGINLPLICEVITNVKTAEKGIDEESLRSAINRAKNELIYVNDKWNLSN